MPTTQILNMKNKDFAIYQFYGNPGDLEPMYIGQSVDATTRYDQHRRDSLFFDRFKRWTCARVSSKQVMDELEKKLIKRFTPVYNRNFNAENCLFKNKGKRKQSEPEFSQRLSFYDASGAVIASIDLRDSALFFMLAKQDAGFWTSWRGLTIERGCPDFGQIEPMGIPPDLLDQFETLIKLRKVNAYEYHQVMKSMKPKRRNNR